MHACGVIQYKEAGCNAY